MRFLFGKNWQSYAKSALTEERIEHARVALIKLCEGIEFKDKKFIDIGFGQGLSLSLACEAGADCLGIDIDSDNLEALETTYKKVGLSEKPSIKVQSILETADLEKEEFKNGFDIVHSWGVLHHTGDMNLAIKNACSLVRENGHFILAIYNRHWSSIPWKMIKWFYCFSPQIIKNLLIAIFYPIIYLAKWCVTGRNPKDKMRGMDFFYDVIDWVGGYPYEYGSIDEIIKMVEAHGFKCTKSISANVPTGCNEFVFKKV
jgi:SAM-dependent methyltransferase